LIRFEARKRIVKQLEREDLLVKSSRTRIRYATLTAATTVVERASPINGSSR